MTKEFSCSPQLNNCRDDRKIIIAKAGDVLRFLLLSLRQKSGDYVEIQPNFFKGIMGKFLP